MKNWQKTVAKYTQESNRKAHADGSNLYKMSFLGEQASYVGERAYADGVAPQAGGQVYSKLSDVSKFYTVVITNTATSGSATPAVVFGANQYPADQQPAGVTATVTVEESSHAQVRQESLYSPFWVNGCRYFTETTSQLNTQIWTLQRKESSGKLIQEPIRPLVYKTANQNQSNQVDMDTLRFGVDGSTQLIVPTIANETVQIVMQIGGRFDPTRIVDGESPLAVANQTPLSTGVTPVIIQR